MRSDYPALDWLLEEENPSVRYRTLTELLGEAPDDPKALSAKERIPLSKPVAKIFSKMDPKGYWYFVDARTGKGKGDGVDYSDYVTTHFNLAFLSELGLGKEDERVSLAVERYLGLQKGDGDFLGHMSCQYAYNIRTFVRMGYKEDPRVKKSIELLMGTERPDGGYLCDHHEGNRAGRPKKSCIRGCVKALTAFAELPELWNTGRCVKLVDYFLGRRVVFRAGELKVPVTGDSASTIFPFVWRASITEALWALSRMGYGRRIELADAWELLEGKRDRAGRYRLDWTPPRSYFVPGKRGDPSKWITLYAYLALKHREEK